MVMTPTAQALSRPPTGIQWTLTTGSKKLSTRFFSVQVGGQSSGLFGLEPPKVRVEVRAKGKCVSVPVSASYGFEQATGDVQLRASATDAQADRARHRDPDGRCRGDRAEDGQRQPPGRHERGGTR